MKSIDRKAWMDKSERLNANFELNPGMEVKDVDGHVGIVVKIVPATEDFHGTIFVWQSERHGYGGDNCEHYTLDGWKRFLRLTDMSLYPEVRKNKP